MLLNLSPKMGPLMTFSGAKRQFFSEAYLERVIEVNSQIDQQQPLVPQVLAMADRFGL